MRGSCCWRIRSPAGARKEAAGSVRSLSGRTRRSDRRGSMAFRAECATTSRRGIAARIGVSLKGCIMYVPWFPCVECAKAIIQSGISELVCYEPDFSEPKWGMEFQVVQEMFGEADLKVRYIAKLEDLSVGS